MMFSSNNNRKTCPESHRPTWRHAWSPSEQMSGEAAQKTSEIGIYRPWIKQSHSSLGKKGFLLCSPHPSCRGRGNKMQIYLQAPVLQHAEDVSPPETDGKRRVLFKSTINMEIREWAGLLGTTGGRKIGQRRSKTRKYSEDQSWWGHSVWVPDASPVLDIVGPKHTRETSASPPGGWLQLTD